MKLIDSLRQFIFRRQHAYRQTFTGPLAEIVLADLATFCRAHESTFHENERVAAQLDGRREVLLRIQQHIRLSPDELFELSTGQARHNQSTLEVSHDS